MTAIEIGSLSRVSSAGSLSRSSTSSTEKEDLRKDDSVIHVDNPATGNSNGHGTGNGNGSIATRGNRAKSLSADDGGMMAALQRASEDKTRLGNSPAALRKSQSEETARARVSYFAHSWCPAWRASTNSSTANQ